MEKYDTIPDRFGIIVGAMKCGTTSLFNYLAAHPEVSPCRTKEPNYFSSDQFRPEAPQSYYSLWDWRPGVHKIAIEASVNYSKIPSNPNCAERIARFPLRDVRFVYCMRNPIDRIESHIYHGVYAGWIEPREAAVSEHSLNVSRYAQQLDAYVERFGRERILLVVLEEFQRHPAETLRRICEFLDIDAGFEFSHEVAYNRADDHYVEHPIWDRIRSAAATRRLARLLPVKLRNALLRSTGQKLPLQKQLTQTQRGEVFDALRSDLERLRSSYGIDPTTTWGIELR